MVIYQPPNKSLLITVLAFIASLFTQGVLHTLFAAVFTISFIIWSYQEVTMGVNSIRKSFGVAGFVILAIYWFIK